MTKDLLESRSLLPYKCRGRNDPEADKEGTVANHMLAAHPSKEPATQDSYCSKFPLEV